MMQQQDFFSMPRETEPLVHRASAEAHLQRGHYVKQVCFGLPCWSAQLADSPKGHDSSHKESGQKARH